MPQITVDLSVVSTINKRMVLDFLHSLFKNGLSPNYILNVFVTCNNPDSDLPEVLEKDFPDVKVIRNTQKKGFAANHNVVVRNSKADYLLIVNDDTIVLPHAIQKMIDFAEQHQNLNVGALCPKLLNPDGTVQPCTYSFPTLPRALFAISGIRNLIPFTDWTYKISSILNYGYGKSRFWNHSQTCEVDTFRGAFVLMRGEAVRDGGPMQEDTMGGGEETEWHYRLCKSGWKVIFFHEAEIIHLGNQTMGKDPIFRVELIKAFLTFFRKHRSKTTYVLLIYLSLFILLTKTLIASLSFDKSNKKLYLTGIRMVLSCWNELEKEHC